MFIVILSCAKAQRIEDFERRFSSVNTMYNKQLWIEIKTKNAYLSFYMASNKRCTLPKCQRLPSPENMTNLVLKTAFTACLQIEMVAVAETCNTTGRVSIYAVKIQTVFLLLVVRDWSSRCRHIPDVVDLEHTKDMKIGPCLINRVCSSEIALEVTAVSGITTSVHSLKNLLIF
ncbi:hypothetical protein WN51_12535 [Melipona quadrifasciata]|uniref:Uncharacterized protein n=1 Tax=Melipona quadrifasciata TaxID=166423 RepID=A0A0N0BHH1_9HYME|nr:hypothetical protein WN51_12535 [Melipona quadrifasciata]